MCPELSWVISSIQPWPLGSQTLAHIPGPTTGPECCSLRPRLSLAPDQWGRVAGGCKVSVFLLQPALDPQRRRTRGYSDTYLRTPTSPTTGSTWDWKGLTDAHSWGPQATRVHVHPTKNHSWAHLLHLEQTCSWEETPRVGFKKAPPDLENRLGWPENWFPNPYLLSVVNIAQASGPL